MSKFKFGEKYIYAIAPAGVIMKHNLCFKKENGVL